MRPIGLLLTISLLGCSRLQTPEDEFISRVRDRERVVPRLLSEKDYEQQQTVLREVTKVLRVGMTWEEAWAALDVDPADVRQRWTWASIDTYSCNSPRFPNTPLRLSFLMDDDFEHPRVTTLKEWELEDLCIRNGTIAQ